MTATVNRATQILTEYLLMDMEGCSGGKMCDWNSKRAEWYFNEEMTNHYTGEYDYFEYPDWLPLVATNAIRETIDWEYIAEKANDYEYNTEIEWLFGEDN